MAHPPLSPSVYRRRRLVAVLIGVAVLAVGVLLLRGGGRRERPAGGGEKAAATPEPPQLPGGGRRLFPDRRIVAFYGAPQAAELGQLGIGTPARPRASSRSRHAPIREPAGRCCRRWS